MTKSDTTSPAVKPPEEFKDAAWQVKIERAKDAHRQGAKLREGKPTTFSTRRLTPPSQD
jgi:hypothetical protein